MCDVFRLDLSEVVSSKEKPERGRGLKDPTEETVTIANENEGSRSGDVETT